MIYGDTDSIMVYTGSDSLPDVIKLGQQIKKEVRQGWAGRSAAGSLLAHPLLTPRPSGVVCACCVVLCWGHAGEQALQAAGD